MGVHHVEGVVGERRARARRPPRSRRSSSRAAPPRRGPGRGRRRPGSTAVTRPGATPLGQVGGDGARPAAHVEQVGPGARCGNRYAAEFSAVRQRCERSTDSWCPWVYRPSLVAISGASGHVDGVGRLPALKRVGEPDHLGPGTGEHLVEHGEEIVVRWVVRPEREHPAGQQVTGEPAQPVRGVERGVGRRAARAGASGRRPAGPRGTAGPGSPGRSRRSRPPSRRSHRAPAGYADRRSARPPPAAARPGASRSPRPARRPPASSAPPAPPVRPARCSRARAHRRRRPAGRRRPTARPGPAGPARSRRR